MNKESDKIVMYDSPEAATYKTNIEGWVSASGRFFCKGKNAEHMARYDGCTHLICECGERMKRGYIECKDCRTKAARERYLALPFKEYDGNYVVTWDGDKYFWNEDDIIDYLKENEEESIDLLFCKPNYYQKVDYDYWADEMPENSDGELPKELEEALDNLNKVIDKLKPISYSPGKIRTIYKLKQED